MNLTSEQIHALQLIFMNNLYYFRQRSLSQSKKQFRAGHATRWNSICLEFANLNLAIKRVVEGIIFYSPSIEALKILAAHQKREPLRALDTRDILYEFEEVRKSIAEAPNMATIMMIELWWKKTFEIERKTFPLGYSFEYLWNIKV